MKMLFYLLMLYTVIIQGCISKGISKELDIPTEHIDLTQFREMSTKDLPEKFYKSKKYINLEMKDDNNYVTLISKILVSNNRIYVMDSRSKKLVAFDTTGKYLGDVGLYNQDFLNIVDFDVDNNGNIFLVDGKQDNILYFSKNLQLVSTRKPSFEVDAIGCLPSGDFLFGLSSWNKKANEHDRLLRTNAKFDPLDTVLRYDQYIDDDCWISDYRFLKTNAGIYYSRPIDNNVYVFSVDGHIKKKYYFDFGTMNVPDKEKKNVFDNMSHYDHYRLLTEFTYVNQEYALGTIWDKRKNRSFFADRVSHILYLDETAVADEFKHIMDFNGKDLYTLILPGEYTDKSFEGLSDSAKKHLQAGGFVVCQYNVN